MDLTVTVEDRGTSTVAYVSGEIDAYTAPELRSTLLNLANTQHPDLVLDMGGVSFLDSTGLGCLIGALNRQRKTGGTLRLASVDDRILKIFRITCLDEVFEIHADLDSALGAAGDSEARA